MKAIDLAPGDIFAGYRIQSPLGEGGMGIVYLAEHIGLGRKVALKLLPPQLAADPRFRERFIRESRTAASLDHPNVIPIYEAGEADGRLFLAMRYVDGTDLNRILHDEGRLEPTRALRILKQVAGALDAAHERGLVHRDVKPANVMLTAGSGDDEHVYLTDFGLTKRMASESGITDTGQFVGSLDYAAPEQFEGGTLTPATDLYSLGCVLYECLTGETPYRREQDAAVMFAHLLAPVPKVTDSRAELLPGIDQVLARAMAKKPDERYTSGAQLITAAADALGLHGEEYRIPTSRLRRIVGARRSRRRRRFTVTAVAVAVVVALVAVVLPTVVLKGGNSAQASLPEGVNILNATTGQLVANIPIAVIQKADDTYYFGGHFWVKNLTPQSFVEIDPRTGRILNQIGSPVSPNDFTVDGDTLWVAEDGPPVIVKMAIGTGGGREVDRFLLSSDPYAESVKRMVVVNGSLWVTRGDGEVDVVDPVKGRIEKRFTGLAGKYSIAAGDGAVWTTSFEGMSRIDVASGTVLTAKAEGLLSGIVLGAGFAWTADDSKGVVYKVDQFGRVVATYHTGLGAHFISFADGMLWAGNTDVGTVTGIDGITGEQHTYRVGHPTGPVAAGSEVVLVEAGQGRSIEDAVNALTGKVAKLLLPPYQFDDPDPALAQGALALNVEFATCANLLNYPDQAAPEGWRLQPEVAAAMPAASADGRTYTFTVRPGYRFSPPSNQPVTAETFRGSIERALSPKLGNDQQVPGQPIVTDIAGEQAFLEGKAEHISGLQANGETLSITLVKPSPDFLERISLPFFCPVPVGTPVLGGAVESHPAGFDAAVPSAGPYYIFGFIQNELIILKRNPNYRGPRPHALDAIVLRQGVDPGLAVERVQDEGWEGITNFQDSIFEPEGALGLQWGPGSAGAGKSGQRYYPVQDGGVLFMEFNANRPLFSDRKVREAASLALDRMLLGRLLENALPAGDLLPSNQRGASTPGSEPLSVPDLDRARELMGGQTGKAVISTNPSQQCPSCAQIADAVKSQLAQIGIDVRIKVVPPETSSYEYAHRPASPVDIRLAGFGGDAYDYVSLAHYLSDLTEGFGDWWPADVRKAGEHLAGLAGTELDARAQSFVALLKDEAVLAPVAHSILPAYLSPGLGCRVFPPFGYGVDLAALCLKLQS